MKSLYVHRDDIRTWQLATLKIQQEIQHILDENDLPGWCGGGTLIGAVRSGGFLYWDNDLDMFFRQVDYRTLLYLLRKYKLTDKYDLYFHRNGYWKKNLELTELLREPEPDEKLLDFEIDRLSRGMFKIFGKQGVPVQFHDNNRNRPTDYVPILQHSEIHKTRHRWAYRNENVEIGKTYHAIPEVCMLPMIEMTYPVYLAFIYRYCLKTVLSTFVRKIGPKEALYDFGPVSNSNHAEVKFEKVRLKSFSEKIDLMIKRMFRSTAYITEVLRQRYRRGLSGRFVAYRSPFFRYYVLPYPYEDVFPIQKMAFEDVEINVPNNCPQVLTTQFGDYMKSPGLSDRIAYPFFLEGRI